MAYNKPEDEQRLMATATAYPVQQQQPQQYQYPPGAHQVQPGVVVMNRAPGFQEHTIYNSIIEDYLTSSPG